MIDEEAINADLTAPVAKPLAPPKPPKSAARFAPDPHRLLPCSDDAEKGAICSCILAPQAILPLCAEFGVQSDWFHRPNHATIYRVLADMDEAGQSIDPVTLTQTLADRNLLTDAGGPALISELFTFLPTAANAEYYLKTLQEKRQLREIIRVGTSYAARAYEPVQDAQGLVDEFEAETLGIRIERQEDRIVAAKDGVMAAVSSIQDLYERRGAIGGVATGFAELDKMIDGLHPAMMHVIAARPSMGKTALAMNMAEYIAVESGRPVGVFSLEMSQQQLWQRLLCSRAKVNLGRVRDGFLAERDFPAMTAAASKFSASKLYIDDTASISIQSLRGKARRMKQRYGIAALFVDYLQLLRSTSRRAMNSRELEISEISAGLKGLAKELEIPIVVLAQLNRQADNRTGSKGRPRLSDLRESGSIEQDADLVGFLVREEYYATDEEEKEKTAGKATLIIAKQRCGPVGDVPLTFLKEFTRFETRAPDPQEELGIENPKSKPKQRGGRAFGRNYHQD